MPWQWDGRGRKSIKVGGEVGSRAEAATSRTWPNYEAAYLGTRLAEGTGLDEPTQTQIRDRAYKDKYNAGEAITDDAARAVYFDKITANYKEEADECLKAEFNDWLDGKHELNDHNAMYPNGPGQMTRQFVFRQAADRNGMALRNAPGGGSGSGEPTTKLDGWRPTWWGKGSLSFLPGVREYRRAQATHAAEEEYMMNLLAEFGPQNIDQAWMYFKHWVKGRPLSEATCLHKTSKDEPAGGQGPSTRAPLGPIPPDTFDTPAPFNGDPKKLKAIAHKHVASETPSLSSYHTALSHISDTTSKTLEPQSDSDPTFYTAESLASTQPYPPSSAASTVSTFASPEIAALDDTRHPRSYGNVPLRLQGNGMYLRDGARAGLDAPTFQNPSTRVVEDIREGVREEQGQLTVFANPTSDAEVQAGSGNTVQNDFGQQAWTDFTQQRAFRDRQFNKAEDRLPMEDADPVGDLAGVVGDVAELATMGVGYTAQGLARNTPAAARGLWNAAKIVSRGVSKAASGLSNRTTEDQEAIQNLINQTEQAINDRMAQDRRDQELDEIERLVTPQPRRSDRIAAGIGRVFDTSRSAAANNSSQSGAGGATRGFASSAFRGATSFVGRGTSKAPIML